MALSFSSIGFSLSDSFVLRCADPDSAVHRCMLRLQEETVDTRSVCFQSVVHILTDEGSNVILFYASTETNTWVNIL